MDGPMEYHFEATGPNFPSGDVHVVAIKPAEVQPLPPTKDETAEAQAEK